MTQLYGPFAALFGPALMGCHHGAWAGLYGFGLLGTLKQTTLLGLTNDLFLGLATKHLAFEPAELVFDFNELILKARVGLFKRQITLL